jgi:beta-galactosidase
MRVDRRSFLAAGGLGVAASLAPSLAGAAQTDPLAIADEGWSLWIDQAASWKDDAIHLPGRFDLKTLPVNPPTGGWASLGSGEALRVDLPTTVEQHLWGQFGTRPYGADEYRYAEDDDVPRYGAYKGVSWWSKAIDIPASAKGRRVMLNIRGARLRAEVFLNEQLVGYSIMSELPITCDLTAAMRPGQANRLAIRITNPGGRFDWRDSTTMMWGKAKLFASHGFGGLDRGLTLSVHPLSARIEDAWVLNTPDARRVTGFMEVLLDKPVAPARLAGLRAKAGLELVDDRTGRLVPPRCAWRRWRPSTPRACGSGSAWPRRAPDCGTWRRPSSTACGSAGPSARARPTPARSASASAGSGSTAWGPTPCCA